MCFDILLETPYDDDELLWICVNKRRATFVFVHIVVTRCYLNSRINNKLILYRQKIIMSDEFPEYTK